ncbi:MAG: LytTR family DNA-binding domain-containing protein [Rudanella sp.]|nr:LytTR family DNA-binding domain-containing protein [Rudanella sp.]
MNVLILEDEQPSAQRLRELCLELEPGASVVATLDSVAAAQAWLKTHLEPDLILVDIHLADGSGFEVFRQVSVSSSLIFTTAYDQYAIEAFKLNSLDYLLKPIDRAELKRAFQKYHHWQTRRSETPSRAESFVMPPRPVGQPYKQRFLVRFGDHLQYKSVDEIAYFYAEDKVVYLVTEDGKRFIVDYRLEQLEEVLEPVHFFRINRKFVARIGAIQRIKSLLNGRLQIFLKPVPGEDLFVSRERATELKAWLDQ